MRTIRNRPQSTNGSTEVVQEEARMGKQLRHPATVIAALALFVALGGGAARTDEPLSDPPLVSC